MKALDDILSATVGRTIRKWLCRLHGHEATSMLRAKVFNMTTLCEWCGEIIKPTDKWEHEKERK